MPFVIVILALIVIAGLAWSFASTSASYAAAKQAQAAIEAARAAQIAAAGQTVSSAGLTAALVFLIVLNLILLAVIAYIVWRQRSGAHAQSRPLIREVERPQMSGGTLEQLLQLQAMAMLQEQMRRHLPAPLGPARDEEEEWQM
ncbi:MAG: hypothetical protein HPY45_09965 [Anaerolineae bacterium]|nr:hypothetical protein [Anaerolineae bacterium]